MQNENNIKIAEFMGKEIITDGISLFDVNYNPLPKYHESWDELIPVIQKCLENKKENIFTDSLNTMNINIVYEDVIEFIKKLKNGKQ